MNNSETEVQEDIFKIFQNPNDAIGLSEVNEDPFENKEDISQNDDESDKKQLKLTWKDSFETGYDESSIGQDLFLNDSGSHRNSSNRSSCTSESSRNDNGLEKYEPLRSHSRRNSVVTYLSVPTLRENNEHINISRSAKRFFSSPAKVRSPTIPISIIGKEFLPSEENFNPPIISILHESSSNNSLNNKMNTKLNKVRRFSQDSGIVTGKLYSDYTVENLHHSQSNDNLKSAQLFPETKLRITTTLNEEETPVESPTVTEAPSDKYFINNSLQNIALLAPISDKDNSSRRSSFSGPTMSKAFGPKIGCELPGTAIASLDLLKDSPAYEKLDSISSSLIQEEMKFSEENLSLGRKFSIEKSEDISISGSFNSKKSKVTVEEAARRISKQDKEGLDPETLFFRDGRKKIDMVLAWEEEDQGVMTEQEAKQRENRRIFQENLLKEGLELELEDKSQSFDEKTYFLKIHIPWRLEQRYAEVLNLKLPVKRFITISVKAWEDENIVVRKLQVWTKMLIPLLNKVRKVISILDAEEETTFKKATAGGNPEEQFIVKDRATTYTNAQRSFMVFQILLRMRFDETEKMGIRRLLNDGTYSACFPLHEGRYDKNNSKTGAKSDRRRLYLNWARPSQWYKKQPLCLIRKYFGDKIALYFCWLGFYTQMLIYPAVVGTLCFLYGLASMNSEDNIPSREICDKIGPGNITLCPLCDKACNYQSLHDSCLFATITYLFDNPATVFFAIFMSFWATTFLELWKRKQSVVVWEWDLGDIDADEESRPEFETNAKTFRTNPVTREREPYMSTTSRAFRFVVTSTAVLFMVKFLYMESSTEVVHFAV